MDTILKLSGFGDTVLSYLLPFLFVLTIVVFFHELGHFLVARWCGVAVKTFSMDLGLRSSASTIATVRAGGCPGSRSAAM